MSLLNAIKKAVSSPEVKSKGVKAAKNTIFVPKDEHLCAATVETFKNTNSEATVKAYDHLALSFTSGRNNVCPMSFGQLSYWLDNEASGIKGCTSYPKHWTNILSWWLSGKGIHVRNESGKQAVYRDLVPSGFIPMSFYDYVPELVAAIKSGSAMVYSPESDVFCTVSEAVTLQESIKDASEGKAKGKK